MSDEAKQLADDMPPSEKEAVEYLADVVFEHVVSAPDWPAKNQDDEPLRNQPAG